MPRAEMLVSDLASTTTTLRTVNSYTNRLTMYSLP